MRYHDGVPQGRMTSRECAGAAYREIGHLARVYEKSRVQEKVVARVNFDGPTPGAATVSMVTTHLG